MDELYHACYRRLVAQVYAFTTDLTEAQDVVQEAFARALARPRGPGRRGQPGGLAAHGRGQRRPPAVAAPQAARHDPAARPAGGPDSSSRRPGPSAPTCARRWPPCPATYREVIVLHYLADLPVDEVAAVLEVPVGTVKSRLSRARAALAGQLDDYRTEVTRARS